MKKIQKAAAAAVILGLSGQAAATGCGVDFAHSCGNQGYGHQTPNTTLNNNNNSNRNTNSNYNANRNSNSNYNANRNSNANYNGNRNTNYNGNSNRIDVTSTNQAYGGTANSNSNSHSNANSQSYANGGTANSVSHGGTGFGGNANAQGGNSYSQGGNSYSEGGFGQGGNATGGNATGGNATGGNAAGGNVEGVQGGNVEGVQTGSINNNIKYDAPKPIGNAPNVFIQPTGDCGSGWSLSVGAPYSALGFGKTGQDQICLSTNAALAVMNAGLVADDQGIIAVGLSTLTQIHPEFEAAVQYVSGNLTSECAAQAARISTVLLAQPKLDCATLNR
ncbi:MAG: hypothetical protein H6867_08455 [Rhodospirillales bacterium]|nr:hypothetical protein [Rhodospirillales bacterium]MCB9995584.1 hypothetical protein [Rhodospirillales bacterium]